MYETIASFDKILASYAVVSLSRYPVTSLSRYPFASLCRYSVTSHSRTQSLHSLGLQSPHSAVTQSPNFCCSNHLTLPLPSHFTIPLHKCHMTLYVLQVSLRDVHDRRPLELLIMDKRVQNAPSATRLREEAINEVGVASCCASHTNDVRELDTN